MHIKGKEYQFACIYTKNIWNFSY